jgi:hypothetical protein
VDREDHGTGRSQSDKVGCPSGNKTYQRDPCPEPYERYEREYAISLYRSVWLRDYRTPGEKEGTMTRELKKVIIPARTDEKIFVKCSFCRREAFNPQSSDRDVDWRKKQFEIAETGIFMKTGNSYPEGGSGTELVLHVCPDCFKEKVIPVLESCALPEGVKFEEVQWDW